MRYTRMRFNLLHYYAHLLNKVNALHRPHIIVTMIGLVFISSAAVVIKLMSRAAQPSSHALQLRLCADRQGSST